MTHGLKTWPEHFQKVKSGEKTFEIRKNDRDFKVGDDIILFEFDPIAEQYTQSFELFKTVTHILHGPFPGLDDGYCIMSIQ
jgi:ASC-1-like (ASCH) protein